MTLPEYRAEMVALAVKPYPYFKMSTVEIEAEETSYTYLTLTKLKNRYPDTIFYFIMGADSLDYFEEWKHPEIICEKAVVLVGIWRMSKRKSMRSNSYFMQRSIRFPVTVLMQPQETSAR